MPGRPPTPTKIHEMRGTKDSRVKDRIEGSIQIPAGPIGDPPEWLGIYGKEEWANLAGHGTYSQILSPLFRGAVLDYCILWDRLIKTERGEAGDNRITATERQMLQSARMQLGLTPASSSKVKAPQAKQAAKIFDLKKRATSEAG